MAEDMSVVFAYQVVFTRNQHKTRHYPHQTLRVAAKNAVECVWGWSYVESPYCAAVVESVHRCSGDISLHYSRRRVDCARRRSSNAAAYYPTAARNVFYLSRKWSAWRTASKKYHCICNKSSAAQIVPRTYSSGNRSSNTIFS